MKITCSTILCFSLIVSFLYGDEDKSIAITLGGEDSWQCDCILTNLNKADTLTYTGYGGTKTRHFPMQTSIEIRCYGSGFVSAYITADLRNDALPEYGIDVTGDTKKSYLYVSWINPMMLELYDAILELQQTLEDLEEGK